jgi:riboflavin transporter FmnP
VFTALAAFLNISPIKIPAPYAPFLIYQLWEIPIVAVSLLYGFSLGVAVSILNTLILFVVYPGALPTGPIYNMLAVLMMLVGIHLGKRLTGRFDEGGSGTPSLILWTFLGMSIRAAGMSIVNLVCLPLPPPIGFSMPSVVVIGLLPAIAFFNASIVLYTVPIGSLLVKAIRSRIKNL